MHAKNWDEHVEDMERMAESAAFLALRDRILELAELRAEDRLLDIGAGTGLLALAAAPRVGHVSALDVSPAMCGHLVRKFKRLGVTNAEVLVNGATELPLGDGAIDVVVSNYCFHHLSDRDKVRALAQIRRVLRPGGRLVFADMMFRIGLVRRRDRAVVALLARRLLSHGPAGLLRLLKNVTRVLAGRGERPAHAQWWSEALLQAGFVDVSVAPLAHEGGIALARVPS
ncbi:MAG TPA: methyltransferase domain-containing protein [Solirubrobacteraceae bacterium]|nr:methyltransferase domain-containing protein [Solirubrobacteraceae bacterium]